MIIADISFQLFKTVNHSDSAKIASRKFKGRDLEDCVHKFYVWARDQNMLFACGLRRTAIGMLVSKSLSDSF